MESGGLMDSQRTIGNDHGEDFALLERWRIVALIRQQVELRRLSGQDSIAAALEALAFHIEQGAGA